MRLLSSVGEREEVKESAGQVEMVPSTPHFTVYKTNTYFLVGPSHQPKTGDEVSDSQGQSWARSCFSHGSWGDSWLREGTGGSWLPAFLTFRELPPCGWRKVTSSRVRMILLGPETICMCSSLCLVGDSDHPHKFHKKPAGDRAEGCH